MSKKNFGLTEQRYNDMRSLLLEGDESLFEEIFLKHFEDCKFYLLQKYNCTTEDAYDATMDTLLEFRTMILNGKIKFNNMRFLFTQMAGQHLMRQKNFRNKQDQTEVIEKVEGNSEIDLKIMNAAWKELGEGCVKLLQRHYYDDVKLKDLVEETSNSYAAIRKQKERCIKKLRTLFSEIKKKSNG